VTALFHLVRHAAHDRVHDTLCGRMPGVSLGASGLAQARCLSEFFATEKIDRLLTSPLERARETAEEISRGTRLSAEILDGLIEIDFGGWTGMRFEALAQDQRWAAWNAARSVNRPPGGESMLEAQARIVTAMERLRNAGAGKVFVLVSHADMIKAALLYHLGLPLDAYSRLDITPASVSTLEVGAWGSRVLRVNAAVRS
jgi:broad specificity phosphatase PhoE